MTPDGSESRAGGRLIPREFDEREEQILDLYKYYEGIGNTAKTQMTSTATWMLAAVSGLFSYSVSQTFGWPLCLKNSEAAYLAALLGIAVCTLNIFMIEEFWQHTKRNWWRATRCKYEVPALHLLVTGQSDLGPPPPENVEDFEPEGTRVARIFTLYRMFTWGFLVLLLAVLSVHFFSAFEACPPAKLD